MPARVAGVGKTHCFASRAIPSQEAYRAEHRRRSLPVQSSTVGVSGPHGRGCNEQSGLAQFRRFGKTPLCRSAKNNPLQTPRCFCFKSGSHLERCCPEVPSYSQIEALIHNLAERTDGRQSSVEEKRKRLENESRAGARERPPNCE